MKRLLAALFLAAFPAAAQWDKVTNGWQKVTAPSGGVSASAPLTAGRVALSTGAATIGDDAGLTYTGTGAMLQITSFGAMNADGFYSTTSKVALYSSVGLQLASDRGIKWSSDATYFGAFDLGLARSSPGVLKVTDGGAGYGSVMATTYAGAAGAGAILAAEAGQSAVLRSNGNDALWNGTSFNFASAAALLGWGGDTFISRPVAATLQHGAADAAVAVPQSIGFQNVAAGNADTPGGLATIFGSKGTGAGAGGPILIQTAYPGAASTVQNTESARIFTPSKWTTLTESSATAIGTLTYGASSVVGAEFLVTVQANDATDFQASTSRVRVSSVRKATGNTVSAVGVVGSDLSAASAGTLTCTYTVTEGASAATLNANCVSSLTQTILRATWQATANGPALTLAQN